MYKGLVYFKGAALCFTLLTSQILNARNVKENFKFHYIAADNLSWKNGGPQPDAKKAMARALEKEILNAKNNIKMAIYGVRAQTWFLRALAKKKKKISVKTVVDQRYGRHGDWRVENFTYKDTPLLRIALGASFVLPDVHLKSTRVRRSIMHNKYLVFDNRKVWTGSTNLSSTGIGSEYNANLSILIDSPALAGIFLREFSQMYSGRRFGGNKKISRLAQSLTYQDGTKVRILFSPQDQPITKGIVPLIKRTRKSIEVAMFFLTHPDIVDALILAAKRKVKVRVILDALSARHGSSRVHDLRKAGVDVRVENWGGKMHMKAGVFDNDTVVLGSMNWSRAGEVANDENTLFIKNQKLGAKLRSHFTKLWTALKNAPTNPAPESKYSFNSCFDGLDNDYDGKIDKNDPGCQNKFFH